MTKWCRHCKRNVEAELKSHPTLADKVLTCPQCNGTLFYPALLKLGDIK